MCERLRYDPDGLVVELAEQDQFGERPLSQEVFNAAAFECPDLVEVYADVNCQVERFWAGDAGVDLFDCDGSP